MRTLPRSEPIPRYNWLTRPPVSQHATNATAQSLQGFRFIKCTFLLLACPFSARLTIFAERRQLFVSLRVPPLRLLTHSDSARRHGHEQGQGCRGCQGGRDCSQVDSRLGNDSPSCSAAGSMSNWSHSPLRPVRASLRTVALGKPGIAWKEASVDAQRSSNPLGPLPSIRTVPHLPMP